jgi:hypothetical protein
MAANGTAMSDVITDYHAKLFAHELSKRTPYGSPRVQRPMMSVTSRQRPSFFLKRDTSPGNLGCYPSCSWCLSNEAAGLFAISPFPNLQDVH